MTGRARVLVTGMGIVSPYGVGAELFWNNLVSGADGVTELSRFAADAFRVKAAGEFRGRIEELADCPSGDLATRFLLTAAGEALADAKLTTPVGAAGRASVVVGTNFAQIEQGERLSRAKRAGQEPPREASEAFRTESAAMAVFERFGCNGTVSVLSLSCASGNAALGEATDLIRRGQADVALAGGYDAITEYVWAGLLALRTMTSGQIRPFDAQRDGTIFGEGAACLVLESAESARKRNARVLAELAGYCTNNNAFHLTAPDKDGRSIARAMKDALADAGIRPQEVDHVNAHATATRYNDVTETAAIKEILGERARQIPVNGIKSMIGHLMGAASAAEAVATVKTLITGIVPPTIHYENPDPACDLDYVPNRAKQFEVKVAINSSSGLGGCNSMVVFRKADGL